MATICPLARKGKIGGDVTKDYKHYSFWLETTDDDLTPRQPLDGSTQVDVAILGAGFTGLWTAYYLLKRDPSLSVAVIEKEIAGYGASGRNGGWVTPGFPVTLPMMEQRFGYTAARTMTLTLYDTVDEVERVIAEEDINAGFHKGGALRIARGPHQLPALESALKTYKRFNLDDHYEYLNASQTAERVRVNKALGSIFSPQTAVVHPGNLVRGLARVVERLGGTIYEQTEVTDFETGAAPRFITTGGDVRAKTIVLAGEAYLSRLEKVRRQVLPAYSLIVGTEPLSDAQWKQIGWENRECIGSNRYTVDYLQKTADGRILFGGRGAPYRYNSAITDEMDRHAPTHEMLRRHAIDWFPMLRETQFSHAWGGALGMPRDWMPTMSYNPGEGLATARGYTGQGVATANLSGRVLTDLITGERSELTKLPTVGHQSPDWEREPFRWLGVRYVQRGFMRVDEEAELTGQAPNGKTLAERLGRH